MRVCTLVCVHICVLCGGERTVAKKHKYKNYVTCEVINSMKKGKK